MKKRWRRWSGVVGLLVASAGAAWSAAPAPVDIPRLDGVTIDGKADDWGERGFRVEIIARPDGTLRPLANLDARFRLAWDDRGLLALVSVADDAAWEKSGSLWLNDAVELFLTTKPGAPEAYLVVATPGRDGAPREMHRRIDERAPSTASLPPLTVEVGRTRTREGYALEFRLPWANLAQQVKAGDELGFQLYAIDVDRGDDRFEATWYPQSGTHADTTRMYRVRLASRPGPAVRAIANGSYERMRRARVRVTAPPGEAGKTVVVRNGRQTLGKGTLALPAANGASDRSRATAGLALPMPARGERWEELALFVDGARVASLSLPSADAERARLLVAAELHAQPYAFTGTAFPPIVFAQSNLVEDLIGPYTIQVTYYDRDYRSVTSAEKPGRYGAVIEVVPEVPSSNGSEPTRPIRRYRTLFRQPEGFSWRGQAVPATLEMPPALGADSGAIIGGRRRVGDFLKECCVDPSLQNDPRIAPLLAGLYERGADSSQVRPADDVWAQDRQWWVGLKRKLTGLDRRYAEPFVCPRPVTGTPAPELRQGTAAEAGMTANAVERIDAVCRAWAADSDQGFGVCLARRGVIFFHKAYGERDGRPMTLADKSWMASISKFLAGAQVLTLVDEGRLRLDEPIDTYLPALRGIPVKKRPTLRHLLTHTSGLIPHPTAILTHWGDDLHDFEEVAADYYPYLEIGQRFEYNGAGFALAGKVVEAVTGEAMPQFSARHFFGPLGCRDTDMVAMAWGAWSTAGDIARVGQMLLNRGAYGSHRFFSETTFAQLLPRPLSETIGEGVGGVYGLGSTFYTDEGLGKGTFGHGAASGATFRIDPENELVIVMTRNEGGKNFGKSHPQFMKAIVDGIAR